MHFLILVALTASAAYHQLGHPRSTDSCLVAASNIASQGRQSLVVDNCIRHWFGPSASVPSEAFYPCPPQATCGLPRNERICVPFANCAIMRLKPAVVLGVLETKICARAA
jgi:hypothetical protein